MELLHSKIDKFRVICPDCGSSWQADRHCQLDADGRLYSCRVCEGRFQVSKAMFTQARQARKVVGIALKSETKAGPAYSDDQNPLIADARRRAAGN